MRITLWISILIAYSDVRAQAWSPGGSKLSFFYIHEIEDIYLVNADGSDFKVLDQHPARDFMPSWSPEGESLIFTSVRDGNHQIYQLSLVNNTTNRLITSAHEDTDGHFSPAGDRVVFSSNRSGNSDLYLFDLNTGKTASLTNTPEYEYTPRWSPDGSKILFKRANEEFGASDLYLIDISALNVEQITSGNQGEFHQNWSPDGAHICYVLVREGTFELHVMNIKTRKSEVLVRKEGFQIFYPNWSPDGESIAFTRDVSDGKKEGFPALFVVDMDGKERFITDENSFPE